MSRRARAAGFAALALVCAGLAAAVAGGYRGGIEAQLGELRSVVVTRDELEARRPLRPADAARSLEARRVPARFAPSDALADPGEAVGREPVATIPAGAYVTAGQLRVPEAPRSGRRRLAPGREAVEVSVVGAEALAAAEPSAELDVDVVVTGEPQAGGGSGRTSIAAEGVKLLALREQGPAGEAGGLGPGGPSAWVATIAARRSQVLRLIHADNYARELRLITAAGAGGGPGG